MSYFWNWSIVLRLWCCKLKIYLFSRVFLKYQTHLTNVPPLTTICNWQFVSFHKHYFIEFKCKLNLPWGSFGLSLSKTHWPASSQKPLDIRNGPQKESLNIMILHIWLNKNLLQEISEFLQTGLATYPTYTFSIFITIGWSFTNTSNAVVTERQTFMGFILYIHICTYDYYN